MAYCGGCGVKLDSEATVCPECGRPVRRPESELAETQTKQSRRLLTITVLALAAAAIVGVVAFATYRNRIRTVSLASAFDVAATGYDTVGALEISKNDAVLEGVLRAAKPSLKEDQVAAMLQSLQASASPSENLSNGQTVSLRLAYDAALFQKNRIALAEETWDYTVSGLEETREIDPFDYVEVSFSGVSPYLEVEITPQEVDETIGALRYEATQTDGLAIGDTITLTATFEEGVLSDKDSLTRYGVLFSELTKSYTVEDAFDRYVLKLSDLTERTFADLQEEASAYVTRLIAGLKYGDTIGYDEVLYEGAALLAGKEDAENRLYLIYSVEFFPQFNDSGCVLEDYTLCYYPVRFGDLILSADDVLARGEGPAVDLDDSDGTPYYYDDATNTLYYIEAFDSPQEMLSVLVRDQSDDFTVDMTAGLNNLQ